MKHRNDRAASFYFDDVAEGQAFESSARKVSEADLLAFTEISGDRHPIHTDAEFAKGTLFGERILQGPFGIAVSLGLFGEFTEFTDAAIALTEVNEWRFLAPIFVGDELTLRMTIDGKRAVSDGERGIVQRLMSLVNQHGKMVQQGKMGLMMWRRKPGER